MLQSAPIFVNYYSTVILSSASPPLSGTPISVYAQACAKRRKRLASDLNPTSALHTVSPLSESVVAPVASTGRLWSSLPGTCCANYGSCFPVTAYYRFLLSILARRISRPDKDVTWQVGTC
jgi:hypothetical protein